MNFVDNVKRPPQRDSKADVSSAMPSSIRSDEGSSQDKSIFI